MHTKIDKTPRQLAREYYNGLLTFAEYRDLRRRLVDEITSVDTTRPITPSVQPVTDTQPIPRILTRTEMRPIQHISSAEVPAAPAKSAGRLALFIIALGLFGVVVGWLIFSGERETEAIDNGQIVSEDISDPEAAVVAAPLIDDFLLADDWRMDALTELTLAWSALQETDQQVLRQSRSFRILSERLRERVLEQRALRDIDAATNGNEELLLSLAGHLGITGLESSVEPHRGGNVTAGIGPDEATATRKVESVAGDAAKQLAVVDVDASYGDGGIGAQAEPGVQGDRLADEPVAPVRAVVAEAPAGAPNAELQSDSEKRIGQPSAEPAIKQGPVTTVEQPGGKTMAMGLKKEKKIEVTDTIAEKKIAPTGEPMLMEPASVSGSEGSAQAVTKDPCPASLAQTRRPFCSDVLADGSKGPIMVVLPSGSFRMGSTREASEQPVQDVTIGYPFAMSAYEVSVAEYRRFCKASGRHCVFPWKGDKAPAVNVSWKDAHSYTNWLSSSTGKTYRLPTEAEWEYAARSRTTGDYPFGDGSRVLPSDARFNAGGPLPVDDRSVNANDFRLRHILGNVREWVEDAWFDNYQSVPKDGRARSSAAIKLRVVRGGSFADGPYKLRPSAREGLSSDTRDTMTGFRLVREIN